MEDLINNINIINKHDPSPELIKEIFNDSDIEYIFQFIRCAKLSDDEKLWEERLMSSYEH